MLITGATLALGSWAVLLLVVVLTGLGAAGSLDRLSAWPELVRTSLWFGLAGALLAVGAASLVWPLESGSSAIFVLLACLALGGLGFLGARSRRRSRASEPIRLNPARLLVLGALALVIVYEAAAAMGPATNYDTGLYHWGAVRYVAEHGTIPGLANLYFPFGYANAWFPSAAILGNGPWQADGFRLLNGFLMVLVCCDVALRLLRPMRWGTWTMVIGVVVCFMPLIGIADFWVTSPTSDTAVMLLTLVAVATLADVLEDCSPRDRAIVIVIAGMLVCLRPTMLPFAAAAIAVVWWRGRTRTKPLGDRFSRGQMAALGSFLLALGVMQALRDRLLSGWLLYPLSWWSFDVPWLAQDPTAQRDATLAAARDPSAPDQWVVAHSWDWIGPWFLARWSLWETYVVLLVSVAALVAVLAARRRGVLPRPRLVILAAAPSALAVLAWFIVSPPSYRFAWGPLFTLPVVLLAGGLTPLARRAPRLGSRSLSGAAIALTAVTVFTVSARFDASSVTLERRWALGPVGVDYSVAPLPGAPTTVVETAGGVPLLVPTSGDQCWTEYPLCTPFPDRDLAFLGADVADGFRR